MTSSSHHDPSALMQVAKRPTPVMVRGAGSELWDHEGRRYLDFVQGWAVNCLGHCSPVVQRAMSAQAAQLINPSPAYHSKPAAELARELTRHAGLDRAFFCTSGAEANEGAVKLARKWGALHAAGAFEVITTSGSFHGRTLAMMSASGKPGFDTRFPPAVPGFVKVAYGDVDAVARAISPRTVAVMVEPIQGEGGVVVPAEGYLRDLRAVTTERGVLLIADEIQTGMGRTGSLFACAAEGVRPDILTLGKGLGGGMPLSALLATESVSCFAPGDQGGTFSGHPVLCAVGLAVLAELTRPGFLQHVEQMGVLLRAGLQRIGAAYGCEARGRGLLCALTLPAGVGEAVVSAALASGLLINSPHAALLRLMPALDVGAADVEELIHGLERCMRQVLGDR